MRTRIAAAIGLALFLSAPSADAQTKASDAATAAWEKALIRLRKADDESIAAINASLAEVGGGFDVAAKNARPFVDDLLGWWGKWKYAAAVPGKLSGYGTGVVNYLFGSSYEPPLASDDFERFARETFIARVLDPDVMKRSVAAAVGSYIARLGAVESALLVDLKADLPDMDIPVPRIPAPRIGEALFEQVDAAAAHSVSEAAADFGVTFAKEAVAQWGGNALTAVVLSGTAAGGQYLSTNNDPFSVVVVGTGLVVGMGVSYAIDKVAEAAGHDPAGRLAAKVEGVLRRAQEAVFEGSDKDRSSDYAWFTLLHHAYPFSPKGELCGRAAARLEASTYLGLRPMLTALHAERLCVRRRIVYAMTHERVSILPAAFCLSPAQAAKAEEMFRAAERLMDAK